MLSSVDYNRNRAVADHIDKHQKKTNKRRLQKEFDRLAELNLLWCDKVMDDTRWDNYLRNAPQGKDEIMRTHQRARFDACQRIRRFWDRVYLGLPIYETSDSLYLYGLSYQDRFDIDEDKRDRMRVVII